MLLKPEGRVDLDHRVFFLQGKEDRAVAASKEGEITILGPGLEVVRSFRFPTMLRGIATHPSDGRLAVVDGEAGRLVIVDASGDRLLAIDPPSLVGDHPDWLAGGFEEIHFDETGPFLWAIARIRTEECEVLLFETVGWTLTARARIADPFGGAGSPSFHPTPTPGRVALWLAAGPDEQQLSWLERTGAGIVVGPEPELRDTTPPVFAPGGGHFLVQKGFNDICRHGFPGLAPLAPPLEFRDEDDPLAESMEYLDDRWALVGSCAGRVFLVDTESMRIVEEAILEGHEPRPIGDYYPNLANEPGWATDLGFFIRLGCVIMFVSRRGRGVGLEDWKDTLTWVEASRPI